MKTAAFHVTLIYSNPATDTVTDISFDVASVQDGRQQVRGSLPGVAVEFLDQEETKLHDPEMYRDIWEGNRNLVEAMYVGSQYVGGIHGPEGSGVSA
jgi:hypothetical protein